MRRLISAALHQRAIVIGLAVALAAMGIHAARTASYDVFPEFAPPLVEVQTEAPGLSTEEVEALVTVPIENVLGGMPWLDTMRSHSVLGLSQVVLLFQENADLLRARQLVAERLAAESGRLPKVASAPIVQPPVSATSGVMKIGMTSVTRSRVDISAAARWVVRPRLMAVPGVANVAIWGERAPQYQVVVDPDRLGASQVTLDAVVRAATAATALSAGGFLDTPNQRLPIRHLSTIETAEDLSRAVVQVRDGTPLTLGDVASVGIGHPPPIGDAVVNDRPGLLLVVDKQPWSNTLAVTRGLERALDELRPALEGIDVDSTIFRAATFVEQSLGNLARAMAIGCALVLLVLLTFLSDWRAALISMLAIPLSVLGAAAVLVGFGAPINTMVLAGLVIAVGEVVDDAIIDVENIARRLRLRAASEQGPSVLQVVLDASLEVRSAVVVASAVVVLVFLPVFFLPGVAGSFFRPLAIAYVLAILASLLVALTVTPALALLLLPRGGGRGTDAPLVRALKRRYRRILPAVVARPQRALVYVGVAFGATLLVLPFLGQDFLPRFAERDFLIHWIGKPGTSLDAMRRMTLRVSDELRAIPGVRNLGAHIGRAEAGEEIVGPNFAELWISIDGEHDYDATVRRIREVVGGYPGFEHDVLTYLRERIMEVLSGAAATLVVRIHGTDLATLRDKAEEVRNAIADVPGVSDLRVERQALVPQVEVRLRPDMEVVAGLTAGDVRGAATTLVQGTVVGQVFHDQRSYDVAVIGAAHARTDLEALRALPVGLPAGGYVRLSDVADVRIVPAPNTIRRENAGRSIDVLCNVAGRDLGSVAADVGTRVRGLAFPRDFHAELLGEHAARQQARRRLLALSVLSLAGILLLLHADFRSLRLTLLVALTLPFALVGGVFAAVLGGGTLSLGSLVGFVTVLGIAARNGIMLVSHYRHLEREEGMPFGVPLVLRAAEERLAPILMTALCAALALLPLVVAGNVPGHEIEYPMAVVILGGLVTSTLLNLFVNPALFAAIGRPREGEAVG
jgi:CzcA family heavy metal efflux pump